MKPIDRQNIQDITSLTPMQEGMLFHYLKNPGSDFYFEQLSLEIEGDIARESFETAWQIVVDRNEMLRCFFRWEKMKHPVRVVKKHHKPDIVFHDLTGMPDREKPAALAALKQADRDRGFRLTDVPLRILLCCMEPGHWSMCINNHHIIYDGWSSGVILNEFFELYNAAVSGLSPETAETAETAAKTPFKDYVTWIQNLDKPRAETFWSTYLDRFHTPTEIPDLSVNELSGPGTEPVSPVLDSSFKFKLETFVRDRKTTLAGLLYTAFGVLLQVFNDCDDVVIGTTVSGRNAGIRGIENMVGLFINTVPLRVTAQPDEPVSTLLEKIDGDLHERTEFESTPLVDIKAYSPMARQQAPLFDAVVVVENYPLSRRLGEKRGTLSVNSFEMKETTHYPLTLCLNLLDEKIDAIFLFHGNNTARKTVEGLARRFQSLLEAFVTTPHTAVNHLDILSGAEKEEILFTFNSTAGEYPERKTIDLVFHEQVNRTPDAIALVGADRETQMTYDYLDIHTRGLALLLKSKDIGPGDIVGVMLERSPEMVAAVIAILKAGAAYLPLSLSHPVERTRFMLADCNAGWVISVPGHGEKVKQLTARGVGVIDIRRWRSLPLDDRGETPGTSPPRSSPEGLAYVIYTSGSTGRPKGVLVAHGSVVNTLRAMQRRCPVTAGDSYLFKTSFLFDVSVTELFGWFFGGGKLAVMEDGGERDPRRLLEAIEMLGIGHINFVPSMFRALVDILDIGSVQRLASLKYILSAGEVLPVRLVERFRRWNPGICLENVYGPTEAAIYAGIFPLKNRDPAEMRSIPIGKPLQNVTLHVLDRYGRLQPVGAAGELYIGGAGLARGYLNRPELTRERFNSFFNRTYRTYKTYKTYKTGDLARRLPDGNVEFLGRIDRQVKVRGFRIELEEIENRLLRHDLIKEAVVTAGTGTGRGDTLYAYVVLVDAAARGEEETASLSLTLSRYLAGELPEYMIPDYFFPLERIPLTGSGKIDRGSLPVPGTPGTAAGVPYSPPGNVTQEKLAAIWADVLELEKETIGIHNSFFQLGGHSLKATSLASRIHREFNVAVSLAEVFENPTIEGLEKRILSSLEGGGSGAVESAEEREYYKVTGLQKIFYIQQRMHPGSCDLNMPMVVGFRETGHPGRLQEVMDLLARRHEALRTSFHIVNGQPVQKIRDNVSMEVRYFDHGGESSGTVEAFFDDCLREFIRPFDMSEAPLFRTGVMRTGDDRSFLIMDMNHIIGDGISENIVIREFLTLYKYNAQLEGLPPATQFKDYTQWQYRRISTGDMKIHETYWLDRLSGRLPQLNLPTDFPRPWPRSLEGDIVTFTLEKDFSAGVRAFMQEQGVTLYMLLLAVYTILLSKVSGQTDILIGSPVAARTHYQLAHTVGPVMNSMVMRHVVDYGKPFDCFLQEVKENTLRAYEHQAYPFEELFPKLDYKESADRTPVTGMSLNVLNIFDADVVKAITSDDGDKMPVSYESFRRRTSKVDVTLVAGEAGDKILGMVEFCTRLFKRESVETLVDRVKHLLRQVMDNPSVPPMDMDIVSKEEKRAVTGQETDIPFYPLTHPQKRIYYTELTYPGSTCNVLPFTVRYPRELDPGILESAIQRVLASHEAFHLRLAELNFSSDPFQYVVPYHPEPLDRLDFSGEGGDTAYAQWERRQSTTPFTLMRGCLFYFALLKFENDESGYFMKFHHMVCDGWTVLMVNDQIDDVYRALEEGRDPGIETNPPYRDFVRRETAYMFSPRAAENRAFWLETLLPLPPEVTLATGKGKPGDAAAEVLSLPFDYRLRGQMHDYCGEHFTSIYRLIFSVLAVLVSRVSGEEDFVITGAGHNRLAPELRKTAGMFVSTIPIRVRVDGESDFKTFNRYAARRIRSAAENQQYPFDVLLEELREQGGRDPGYLLNVNFIAHGRIDVAEDGPRMIRHFPYAEPSPVSIHLDVDNKDISGELELEWDYQSNCFTPGDIRSLHRALSVLLRDAVNDPLKPLDRLEWLEEQEKTRILYEFNHPDAVTGDTGGGRLLHVRFEDRALRSPDRVALLGPVHGEGDPVRMQSLSYGQLNTRADGLARYLETRGVKPGMLVGMAPDPCVEMITVILGILKAGAAYVPLDPAYPPARLKYIVGDSGLNFLVCFSRRLTEFRGMLDESSCEVLDIGLPPRREEPGTALGRAGSPDDTAYVIYTSGSTGRPKGVSTSHANVCAYLEAFEREFSLTADDTVIQQASCSFDAFVEEMYPVLFRGGTLAVAPGGTVKDAGRLIDFIRRYRVTFITCSPLLLNQLDKHEDAASLRSIHTFISGGDVLKKEYIGNLLEMGAVYNTYGPTESTVCATYYRCKPGDSQLPPIGKPIAGYGVYILSVSRHLQPIGTAGELCVSGPGLARGYLNRPELTEERFNRFLNRSYKTYKTYNIYKTGDLACWLPDGNIRFLGRIDTQVSIRGYRVETGEIENCLNRRADIRESAVICREDAGGDRYLCAYVVSAGDAAAGDAQLKTFLSQWLPSYMVPSYFVEMDRLPMTPGGKIDTAALPLPRLNTRAASEAPLDGVETRLSYIWRDLLSTNTLSTNTTSQLSDTFPEEPEHPHFGLHDDFFNLGGHSLKVTLLASAIHKEFDVKIPMDVLFRCSRLGEMADYIRRASPDRFASVPPVESREYYPVSSAQRRMFIMQQMREDFTGYNESTALEWEGPLEMSTLEEVFRRLIRRHEALRTSYLLVSESPVQKIHPAEELSFTVDRFAPAGMDTMDTDIEVRRVMNDFVRPFDLRHPPLLRAAVVELGTERFLLLVDVHHIAVDGASTDILVREFAALYDGASLPPLSIQYKDYTLWQDRLERSGEMARQERYWLDRFAGGIPRLELPLDSPRSEVSGSDGGGAVSFEIRGPLMEQTRALTRDTGTTFYMVLLAVYYILLARYGGTEDIVIGTGIAGRRHVDLQQVIGMFVNMLALRCRPSEDLRFSCFLEQVRETTLNAHQNQDYPFDRLVEALSLPREAGRNPVFDTQFTFKNLETAPGREGAYRIKPSPYVFEGRKMQFDLSFNGFETPTGIVLSLQFHRGLFDETTISDMSGHYLEILEQVTNRKDLPLRDIVLSHRLRTGISSISEEEAFDYDF